MDLASVATVNFQVDMKFLDPSNLDLDWPIKDDEGNTEVTTDRLNKDQPSIFFGTKL